MAKRGASFATKQYTKSIVSLRRSIAARKQEPLTALMGCILFVCFDSLRGQFADAIIHLEAGLGILENARLQKSIDSHTLNDILTPIFLRLCIQSILFLDTSSKLKRQAFALKLISITQQEHHIPETFESLEAAHASMNLAADGLFRVFHLCDSSLPMGYVSLWVL